MLKFEAELRFRLRHYPHIRLVAVIYGVRVRVSRRQSIINAKQRHIYFICPLSGVALVTGRVLANEAAAMEMNDAFSDWSGWFRANFGLEVDMSEFERC